MRTYSIEIEGITALMHHQFPREALFGLLASKAGKKKQKVEETPREIAERHVYKNDKGEFVNPTEFFRQSFVAASSEYKLSNSSRKSLKSIAGAVLRPKTEFTVLTNPDTGVPLSSFEVDVRKATNHLSGAVCVCRPRFDKWACSFEVDIDTDLVPLEIVQQVLTDAGTKVGVGSFRVANKGFFGQFRIKKFELVY